MIGGWVLTPLFFVVPFGPTICAIIDTYVCVLFDRCVLKADERV